MATSPIVSSADGSPEISYGPLNPKTQPVEAEQQQFNVPDEYKDLMVKTITAYRGQWAPDRMNRMARWMKNILMYRGQQILEFDAANNTFFDAWQWWQKEGNKQDGQSVDLDQFVNNISQQLCDAFVGTMTRSIPPTIIQPENAEDLADVTTAKAGQESISIVERLNGIEHLVRDKAFNLYNHGMYVTYTRGVQDGEYGWDEEEVYGDIPVEKPDRLHCFRCGTDTPVQNFLPGAPRLCPKCGAPLGDESFYPSETSQEQGVTGIKKTPKAMVRWDVYGPLEFDADPNVQHLKDTPVAALDLDVDVGTLRLTFKAYEEKIKEGQEIATTPNASYEKLRRAEATSQTTNWTPDDQNYTATYSRNWMQPSSYWRLGNKQFAEFMLETFPEGCKVSLVGPLVVDIRPAVLTKELSVCLLKEKCGLFPPSIADNVVPFNERLNDAMNIIHDWIQRCAAGMTIYDKGKIDSREMAGKVFPPGELMGVQTKADGLEKALSDSIYQFQFTLEPRIFEYPAMLIQMAESISGVMPQTFGGGTQKDVETAKGQAQQLDTSLTKLNIYWANIKEEQAASSQNAIECLQKLIKAGMVSEMWEVIQSNGAEFRNNYINFEKMNGRVKVYPQTDEGLPQSPQQVRDTVTNLVEEAGKQNPIAMKILDVVPNQEKFMTILAPQGTVIPGAAQRAKTQQDINTLLTQDVITSIDPQTGQPTQQLPTVPEFYEDFPIARDTVRLFMQENFDEKKKNPAGWQRLGQFYQLLEQQDMQQASEEASRSLQVKMAGSPPPPKPPQQDPTAQAALRQLTMDAVDEVNVLQGISHMTPAQTGGNVTGQVQAAGKILDSALKAQTAAAKERAA